VEDMGQINTVTQMHVVHVKSSMSQAGVVVYNIMSPQLIVIRDTIRSPI